MYIKLGVGANLRNLCNIGVQASSKILVTLFKVKNTKIETFFICVKPHIFTI